MGGGNRNPRSGIELDPLIGMDDESKPLRSRLLAVPSLRAKYLEHVNQIAEHSLDWSNLGPQIAEVRTMLADEVKADTRKLESNEAFDSGVERLKTFVERRRAYLNGR